MLRGYLPPLRAVAVVLAVLIGAYGLEPGALTTTLLLIMYALARYAAVTGLAWYRFGVIACLLTAVPSFVASFAYPSPAGPEDE